MEVYKILLIVLSFLFVFSAVRKISKGMSFEDYSIGRGLGLWMWFGFKLVVVIFTIVKCIDWSFLNYKV